MALLVWAEAARCADAGLDPTKALTQLGLDSWTTDQGLPNATVNAVRQTRDGYVWLGTYDGLARFDGSRFTVFHQGQGLGSNGVRALAEDRDGALWIGTNGGGVSRLVRGAFTRFTTADGLPSEIVWSLAVDVRDGSLWAGTNGGGLARLRGRRFEPVAPADSGRVVAAIAQAPDGTLWLAAGAEGLRRISPDGRSTAFTQAEGLPSGLVNTVTLARDGTLWGGSTSGPFRIRDGVLTPLPAGLEALRSANVSSIVEDAAGTLWFGTNGAGVARFAGSRLSFLGAADGVGDVVYSLLLDGGGQLWIGTNGAGVHRLRDDSFTTYGAREGLSRDFAYTTFQDRDGTLWVGTAGGLDRMVDGRFVGASPPFDRPIGVRSITEDAAGTLWVGTYGAGVWSRTGSRWRQHSSRDGLASDTVRAVLVDRTGRVWAATNGGLSVREGETWRSFHAADGLPLESLIGLAEDRDGAIWVGSDGGGLVRYADGRFRVFTTRDGLASDLTLALHVDGDGVLWVGTNGGLSRRTARGFESFTSVAGLSTSAVTQIVADAQGRAWLGTSLGIARVDRSAFRSGAALEAETFDRLDGMRSSQCTAPGQPAGFRTRDGRLWFATTRGVATVDPARLRIDTEPPGLVVEEVTLDGRTVPFDAGVGFGAGIVVPPGPVRLELRFAVLARLASQRPTVRFRLEGFDPGWVDAGDRRRVDYTGAPPGAYRFRLQGRSRSGAWGEPGLVLPVRVRPFFYQTRTFAALSLLAAAGLVTLGFRLRTSGLRARQRELTRLVEERTKGLAAEKERATSAHRDAERLLRERERAEAELRRQGAYLASLHETSLAVMDRLETDALLGALVERAAALLGAPDGFLYLETPDASRLECRVWLGNRPRDQFAGPNEGAVGHAWKSGEPVVIDDYDVWSGRSPQVPPGAFGSMLAVPLRFGGRVRGALGLAHAPSNLGFGEEERRRLVSFAQLASIALDNAHLFANERTARETAERLEAAVRDELAERTRAQRQAERSESRYRDLFEQSLGLLCTHDLGGTLLSVNPAAARALGRPRQEIEGRRLQEFLPPEVQPAFERYLSLIGREREAAGRLVVLDAKGERRTWRYRNVLRDDPDGQPFVIGFSQDVSEEEAFQAALRESEERFRQLAENIDAAFFIRTPDPPSILYISPAYERIWGRPRTSSLEEFLTTVHPEDRPMLVAAVARQAEGYDVEYRIVRPDGEIRWIRSRTSPIADEEGRVFRVAGIAEDITARKSVERMRDDLTHTLVHDLRNPLTSITAALDLIERSFEPSAPDAPRAMLQVARRGGRKLLTMVDAILDVSRLEEGAMPLSLEPVPLAPLAEEVQELQRPLAHAQGVTLRNEVPVDLADALADRALLARVLQNLVGNAIKFTPSGGTIRVRAVRCPEQAGMLAVTVEDDGPGIPEEVRARLFEKFVTGRQSGRGSGLGLLFCRLAVEAQGGRIRAESPVGGGATLRFTLPVG